MLQAHPNFVWPDESATLWRYMPFEGLLSSLQHGGLWLARSDTLGDRHEGAYGPFNKEMRPQAYADLPPVVVAQLEAVYQEQPSKTYVNCWHLADEESAAMWEIYARRNRGVSVKTSFRRLSEGIAARGDLFGGLISYSDNTSTWTPEGNLLLPFLRKRPFFSYEREFRLVVQNLGDASAKSEVRGRGFWLRADLNSIIEEVVLAPATDPWIRDAIAEALRKHELSCVIRASDMDDEPMF